MIPQLWSYGGIEFGVGRIEAVSTHPDYRRRGLVRAQFEVMHEWSARRGHLVQSITGIPWFYRQFGYEMCLALEGGRTTYPSLIPHLKDGEAEPFVVREATEADLSFVASLYDESTKRTLVNCVRDEAIWRYELNGRSDRNDARSVLRVVETPQCDPVGFLAHSPGLGLARLGLEACELKAGVSRLMVAPSSLRYLKRTGLEYERMPGGEHFGGIVLRLGEQHPLYGVGSEVLPRVFDPYAWYIRMADVEGFVRHVAPAIERNLAQSVAAGHTGELRLSFYRSGLRLFLGEGRLAAVEPWQPTVEDRGSAGFPDLTFLQLLFGYRILQELEYPFADCWAARDESRALLNALFPKRTSSMWTLV